jgi:hypothetical protein
VLVWFVLDVDWARDAVINEGSLAPRTVVVPSEGSRQRGCANSGPLGRYTTLRHDVGVFRIECDTRKVC